MCVITSQNNNIKNRGLKKAKWSFKILNYEIENLNKISEISKKISKDYKITFTNDILEIDITLKNSNYKSFILNSFKEITSINNLIIECAKTKVLEIDIYNIYDILINIIIDIDDEIKLLKNAVNNHSTFLELYSNNFESKINEIKKFLKYLNKDSLSFFKIIDVNFLEIERQSNLLDRIYAFYKNYKKHILIHIYNDSLLINDNYKLNEITIDENEMVYSLSSQCDTFNPYYNKNNLNIEEIIYNSAIDDLKKQKNNLIKNVSSDFIPKHLSPTIGLIGKMQEKNCINLNYEESENIELEKLQNILRDEITDEIKQEKEIEESKLTIEDKEKIKEIEKKELEKKEEEKKIQSFLFNKKDDQNIITSLRNEENNESKEG
jgi:hypothetical protein